MKSSGTTPSERYLAHLCKGTFLNLWSYPNIFRDQKRHKGRGDGKELGKRGHATFSEEIPGTGISGPLPFAPFFRFPRFEFRVAFPRSPILPLRALRPLRLTQTLANGMPKTRKKSY